MSCSHCSLSRRQLPSALVAVWLALSGMPAAAQNEISPAQQPVAIDWPSVARDVQALSPDLVSPRANVAATLTAEVDKELATFAIEDKETLRPLARLNLLVTSMYSKRKSVPIPVLAPIDIARYIEDVARTGFAPQDMMRSHLAPSVARMQFLPKTAGYDAILAVHPDLLKRHQVTNTNHVAVHIGGHGLVYDRQANRAPKSEKATARRIADSQLKILYPDMQRSIGPDDITYSFTKYGVPYFASITCVASLSQARNVISCPKADAVLRAVLRDLRLLGGTPTSLKRRVDADAPQRPQAVSETFRFFPPGNLPDEISQDRAGGVKTRIRWGNRDFRFPIELPNAHANSQLFMHGGNCNGAANKMELSGGRYKCRQLPTRILFDLENHLDNYAYPWRDTYCEVRNDNDRKPPDCLHPRGHEGQDIRPRECILENGRCKIDMFDVVAVTNGNAVWTSLNHLRLIADDDTNLYYMYMHMSPTALSQAGMMLEQAVPVHNGQKVGKVGNWWKTDPAGTTAHLHFEIRTPGPPYCAGFGCTSAPYWTLLLAYERLIGMHGTEVTE